MIKQLTIILSSILLSISVFATKYYVRAGGSNSNTGLGPTTAQAWQTLSKVSSSWSTFNGGDTIFFNRGDVFSTDLGGLIATKSGIAGNPIVVTSYGTGARPIFSGLTSVTGFTNVGNLWTSPPISGTNYCNIVTLNDVPIAMGRYPNTGYFTYQSHVSNTSVTSSSLTGTPNFAGGTVCIRTEHAIITNDSITSQAGSTINYTAISGYFPQNGYGLFIEKSPLTLDVDREWYFDPATRRLKYYSTTVPAGLKISTKDTLVYLAAFDNISFDSIYFEGGNIAAVTFGGSSGTAVKIIIRNCDFINSGRNAIYCTNDSACTVSNCTFNYSQNNAIYGENESGKSIQMTVTNNSFNNSGTLIGMGYINQSISANITYNAVTILGHKAYIQYNTFDSTGHVPIALYYDSCYVLNNFISTNNFITDDGGGVNFFDLSGGSTIEKGRIVRHNIIINGIGAPAGCPLVGGQPDRVANAVYIDDNSDGLLVDSNSTAYIANAGFYIHNGTNVICQQNTFYNSALASALYQHDDHSPTRPIRGITFTNNICFATASSQFCQIVRTRRNDVDSIFTLLDFNIYARPIFPGGNILQSRIYYAITPPPPKDTTVNYNLTKWQLTFPAYDQNSDTLNSNTGTVIFQYNASNSPVTVNFPGLSYYDPRLTVYNNSTILQPWESIILLPNGVAPGGNETMVLRLLFFKKH